MDRPPVWKVSGRDHVTCVGPARGGEVSSVSPREYSWVTGLSGTFVAWGEGARAKNLRLSFCGWILKTTAV
jgi:hypothetical protein